MIVLTLEEQELLFYSPERFKYPNLVAWRTWDYWESLVPKDNIEGFND